MRDQPPQMLSPRMPVVKTQDLVRARVRNRPRLPQAGSCLYKPTDQRMRPFLL